MKAPICCTIAQNTAKDAMTLAETPEFGHGETAERPMAAPNVRRTNEIAIARKAPASTAPHSTKLTPAVGIVVVPTGPGPTVVMALRSKDSSMQPEQAEDEHNDDHEANEIDDAVHDGYLIKDNPEMDCARSNCSGKTRV
jgi:hypothetical protein